MARTTCSKCGELLDGSHPSYCKTCFATYARERRTKDPEKYRQYQRQWREEHPDYDAAWLRARYARDPEQWNEYHRQWRTDNPESRKRTRRKGHLQSLYGLSIPEFEALLHAQDNKCLICQVTLMDGQGRGSNAHVDHDHVTNEVRGILCGRCNNGLGCFADNVDALIAAAEYVSFFKKE